MYQALYRKWRPRSFDDVISQPHITTALRNQIREEKTAHAYLFTGSRGTGKTTCARILAKTVNCEHRTPEGNPCLECEICRDAERGALADIIEIDAASNNSVEDIRDLREGTVYLPERCCYKVYIIDEVHMLSPSAWGALLKVMEEPPEYVKFILATTEVHKVPATIISRCQRYDFHRIRTADIAARLTYIAGEENLSLDPAAAQLIAHLSDGGMRDALSLLDQCASGGDAITAASVTAAAGVAGRDSVFAILEAVQAQDAAKALEITGALYDQSKDMVRLCDELLEQLRNMMLLKSGSGQPELLTCLPDEQPRLEELTRQPSLDTISSLGRGTTLTACGRSHCYRTAGSGCSAIRASVWNWKWRCCSLPCRIWLPRCRPLRYRLPLRLHRRYSRLCRKRLPPSRQKANLRRRNPSR